MPTNEEIITDSEFESALDNAAVGKYLLRLYVAGSTPRSLQAIANLKRLCADRPEGCFDLQVVDIYQQPELAEIDQIIAVPTLIKVMPLPLRRLIGDMSDSEKVLKGLGLPKSGIQYP